MRLFMVVAILIFAMPMTGFGWAEGTNILLDPNLMCKKSRRLRGRLAEICRHDSSLLKEIINGINLGFRECEFQFRNRRWNCTVLRKSMRKILMKDTRETGFVNAITAAGVTYAVTKGCTSGNLMECDCDRSHARRNGGHPQMVNAATATSTTAVSNFFGDSGSQNLTTSRPRRRQHARKRKLLRNVRFPEGEWEWGGCSDNVNFGFRSARAFLDNAPRMHRKRSDLRTLVKLHNNNAGRLAIRDAMRVECKCHGLSGSCTVKTCWLKMPPFREVSSRLREKFDAAHKVALRNDGNSFMPEYDSSTSTSTMSNKHLGKYDLVYADDSSDFCTANSRTGSLGTQGRECNATSIGAESCDLLCCSRGYKHRTITELINCRCVFKWCCEVTCEKCLERREVSTCL